MSRVSALLPVLLTALACARGQVVMQVDLHDGSRLNGQAVDAGVLFSSSLGETTVPWDQVTALHLNMDSGDVVELAKGGRVSGRVKTTALGVATVLGRARLPISAVKRVSCLAPASPGAATAGAGVPPAGLKAGLCLYYSFDSDTRGIVKDDSGCGHDGQRFGGRFTGDGVFRGAYEFGGQDYITVRSTDALCPPELTISVWVRPARDMSPAEGHVIISKAANMTGYLVGYHDVGTDHPLEFLLVGACREGMYTHAVSRKKMKRDTWHHVAAVYDGRRQKLFFNGELEDSSPRSGPIAHTHTLNLWIGAQIGKIYCWEGAMDELRIYDRALDDSAIRQLSLRVVPPAAAGRADAGPRALSLEIDLADQTVVKGTAAWTTLPLAHATLGTLNIPWPRITGVTVRDGGRADVALDTGDLFVGQLMFEKAALESVLGRVSIARENIRAIRVTAPSDGGPATAPAAAGSATPPALPPRKSVREDGATRF